MHSTKHSNVCIWNILQSYFFPFFLFLKPKHFYNNNKNAIYIQYLHISNIYKHSYLWLTDSRKFASTSKRWHFTSHILFIVRNEMLLHFLTDFSDFLLRLVQLGKTLQIPEQTGNSMRLNKHHSWLDVAVGYWKEILLTISLPHRHIYNLLSLAIRQ